MPPERKPAPAHWLLVALGGRNLFPVCGQGCIYFAIHREQRKGLGGGVWGLLLGTRIPALPVVLLTPDLGWLRCHPAESLHRSLRLFFWPGHQVPVCSGLG